MPNDAPEIPSQAGKTQLFNLIAAVLVFGFGTLVLLLIIPMCIQIGFAITCQAYEVESFSEGRWAIKSERKGLFPFRSLYRVNKMNPLLTGIRGYRKQGDNVIFKTSNGFHVLDLRNDTLKEYDTIDEAPAELRKDMQILGEK